MAKAKRFRASKVEYVSPTVKVLPGFETPFEQHLDPSNRWVILAGLLPWDMLVGIYRKNLRNKYFGAGSINPRVAIGSLIIKHICNLSDRDTIQAITENIYMQYFIGYSSFSKEPPFDSSLFVELRVRLDINAINEINEQIMKINNAQNIFAVKVKESENKTQSEDENNRDAIDQIESKEEGEQTHKGTLIIDATACPQDIKYPTDLDILNSSREKSEEIIDTLHDLSEFKLTKPRTYREVARKKYLKIAQKKKKTKADIRKGIREQLQYLRRNIKNVNIMLDNFNTIPLDRTLYKYLLVIQTAYDQQKTMYDEKSHSIENRIVSIHQPHVRPIVRGKSNAAVEFGSKIMVSLTNGIAFLEKLSWEAYNEGSYLLESVEAYKKRIGCYPQEVLADKIFCNRENRAELKLLNISLKAKPLGRPSINNKVKLEPGERNPIEGKFGQAKSAYGMNRIKARLDITSQSWIATIILVLNLIKLAEGYYAIFWRFYNQLFHLIQQLITKSLFPIIDFSKKTVNYIGLNNRKLFYSSSNFQLIRPMQFLTT